MGNLFGTDGIRGTANESPLTPDSLARLGQAFGTYWQQRKSSNRVLLAHDSRLSHDLLESALISGLISTGMDPQKLELSSTPALSFLCRENHLAGGIMISASHNPFEDNGVKPLQASGEKFSVQQEKDVAEIFSTGEYDTQTGKHLGQVVPRENWVSNYIQELTEGHQEFPGHVVVDCANGGTSRIAPTVLESVTRTLTVLNDQPSGTNINDNAGSLHPEVVAEAVRDEGADLGFALDGDGDRVVAVDEKGDVADGDVILYLLANTFSDQQKLPDSGLVITSMSNLGLRLILEQNNLKYEVVGVGDRVVYSKMKQLNWRLGGEQSGHIIDREWLPTGDGVRTILSVMEALIRSGRPLSDWDEDIEKYPQVLHNIDVDRKPPLEDLTETQNCIQSVEEKLGREGRVLVRYSGTEPVARIMLEGTDEGQLHRLAGEIGDTLQEELRKQEEVPS